MDRQAGTYYTVANPHTGAGCRVYVPGGTHEQHIWHTSTIYVSPRSLRRLSLMAGPADYYTPVDCCGQANRVYVRREVR